VDAIRGADSDPEAVDPMAARRARAREYVLGPDSPDAVTRFHAAVETVFARYERRRPATDELATSSPS
jgi:hypothetical protein